jgi:hypothetical protein
MLSLAGGAEIRKRERITLPFPIFSPRRTGPTYAVTLRELGEAVNSLNIVNYQVFNDRI